MMTQETESAQIPVWITEREREKATREQRANEITQQQIKASMFVQQEGPTFWQQILERLKVNTDELNRLGDELHWTISPPSDPRFGTELECRIQVDRRSTRLGATSCYTNLFFQPGGARIRRWYQDQPLGDLELRLGTTGVVAMIDGDHPMSSQQLADYIVQRMAELVRH